MFELKEIWSKKGWDFRIKEGNNFIAKRMKESCYFLGRTGTKYSTNYYKKTEDGWIYLLVGEQRKVLDFCVGLA